MAIASNLLQAKKTCPQACNLGSQCVFHKDQSLKVWQKTIQNWQRYSTFDEIVYSLYLLFRSSYFQQKFNNFVNFDCFSPNFQGLILTKNTLTTQVDMLGDMFLCLVANLKQGVIYFIKQEGGNHKIAWVYLGDQPDSKSSSNWVYLGLLKAL